MTTSAAAASRHALVVRGGWDGHQPVETTDLLIPHLERHGFSVRIENSPAIYADAAAMADMALVMQCMTMSTITKDEVTGLRAAIAAGTGLAGWHGGIADSYRDSADYLQLVGAQFAAHPPRLEDLTGGQSDFFVLYRVERTASGADHEITRDLIDFDVVTEQYWVLHDDYSDVLATTTIPARPDDPWRSAIASPVVFTRQWGKGRIFVTTLGHDASIVGIPAVRTLIERGLLWAAR